MKFLISGKVVKGKGYGRKLGYPTVNLEVDSTDLPVKGVYQGEAVLRGEKYRAGIILTPDGAVEAHLIGYEGDAYGEIVTLELKKFLRDYRNFKTEAELIAQIEKDLKMC